MKIFINMVIVLFITLSFVFSANNSDKVSKQDKKAKVTVKENKKNTIPLPQTETKQEKQLETKQKNPFDEALEQIKSENPQIRRLGVNNLAQIRDLKAIPYLEELLNDKDDSVRLAAIDTLGIFRSENSVDKILNILKTDPNPNIRQACIISLSYMPYIKDPQNMILAAEKDQDISVRYMAIRVLGTLKIKVAENKLIDFLKDNDIQIRKFTIEALGNLKSTKSLEILKKYITDKDEEIRIEAIKAIGEIGDKSFIEYLKPRLNENSSKVQIEAALALAKLGDDSGLEIGYKYMDNSDFSLQQKSLTILSLVGNEKSIEIIDKKIGELKDSNLKPIMEFTRQRIQSRLKAGK